MNKTFKIIGSMTIITLFAKLSGLLRVSLFASLFGTSHHADVFLGAARLPVLFFDLTLGAAILSTFIPIFNQKLTLDGKKSADEFANNFVNITLLLTFIICTLGVIFSPQIVRIMLPGFDAYMAAAATQILRILFPVIIFTALAFTSVGILQSHGEFNIPALISLVANVIMILYLLVFGQDFGIVGISIAMLIGWSMQFLIQIPSLIKKGFRYKFVFKPKDSAMRGAVKLAIPVLVSSWVHPIGVALNVMFASGLDEGSISGLEFANTLYIVGFGIFALATSNFIFPALSKMSAAGDAEGFKKTVKTSLSYLTYAVVPIMALFIALATPIIQLLYQRGAFDDNSVRIAAGALMFYSFGMVAHSIAEILNKTFFAMQDGKTPMFAALIGIACNAALSSFLMLGLGIQDVRVLALSAAVGMTVTAAILIAAISVKKDVLNLKFVTNLFRKIICGASVAVAAFFAYSALGEILPGEGVFSLVAKLSLASVAGLVVYLVFCWILRIEEQRGLLGKLLKR